MRRPHSIICGENSGGCLYANTHGCMAPRNVDIVNMQHPPRWLENASTISQQRIEVRLEKVVNNTENEKYSAFFNLTDYSPYAGRSNRSLTSLLSAMMIEQVTIAQCRQKRIYLSS